MKRIFRVILHFCKLLFAYLCALAVKFFNKQYRNCWLISERGDDARDNGWFFYEHIKKNHPEINVKYVIAKTSADYPKVARLGKPIVHESFEHYVFFALSKVNISTHVWGGDVPKADYFKRFGMQRKNKKVVFLQHGVIKDWLPSLCADKVKLNMFVCGAKPEYDFVLEKFGHGEKVTQYTGLARFDNLHDAEAKNQVLFMPTFRKWLQGKAADEVAESEYVRAWNEAINDKRLAEALKSKNLELIFYPHYVMQKHIDLFKSNNELVKIARFADYDVQTLLIESKLLVTDFSSVFFDFGYMKKPVLYYQFDREKYINEHYDFTKGYFSYDDDGFGSVVFNKDELINAVISAIERDFALEPEYEQRIAGFFPLNDKHNCERIFEKIQCLTK